MPLAARCALGGAVVALYAACFSPDYGARPFTCAQEPYRCPQGYTCVAGFCENGSSTSPLDAHQPGAEQSVVVTGDLGSGSQDKVAFFHDTDTDFGKDGLSNGLISGTGAAALVQINTSAQSVERGAGAGSVLSRGKQSWTNPGGITAEGGAVAQSVATTNTQSGYETDWLVASSFKFVSPAFASVITGVQARIRRYATCATPQDGHSWVHDSTVLRKADGTNHGAHDLFYWPTSWQTAAWGGPTHLWDTALTWADVQATGFGLALYCTSIQGMVDNVKHSAYVDYIALKVYYRGTEATLTATVPEDPQSTAWVSLEAEEDKPSKTSITYDVLEAAAGSLVADGGGASGGADHVLLSGRSGPSFSLAELPYKALQIRVHLKTSDPAVTPSLKSLKVLSRQSAAVN